MAVRGTILLIDDEPLVREALALSLESLGHGVLQAENGRVGIETLRAEGVDTVLCDLRMPELDGLGFLALAREEAPEIPVIVVSGAGLLGDAIAALKLGAFDYITKPVVEQTALDRAVRRALEHVELVRENARYRRHLEHANDELRKSLRRLQEDEEAGRQIQFRLLPEARRVFDGIEVTRALVPSAHLSGDFVDCFPIDTTHLGFYLADVSGHGVPSALVTVLLKSFMHRLIVQHEETSSETILSPGATLALLNEEIVREQVGKHLTIFYGVIDQARGTLTYASAGQFPWPMLYDGTSVTELEGRGLPVGLFEFARYDEHAIELPARFVLALCSDGVLEILPQPKLEAKLAALRSHVGSLATSVESLRRDLELDGRVELPDDVTLLMLRREAE